MGDGWRCAISLRWPWQSGSDYERFAISVDVDVAGLSHRDAAQKPIRHPDEPLLWEALLLLIDSFQNLATDFTDRHRLQKQSEKIRAIRGSKSLAYFPFTYQIDPGES